MKVDERRIYRQLISLPPPGYGLCNICRYAEFYGNCEEADLKCHCGIECIEENADDIWKGSDCWAFKPRWDHEDIVDMVGIFLQGGNSDMSKCEDHRPKKLRALLVQG